MPHHDIVAGDTPLKLSTSNNTLKEFKEGMGTQFPITQAKKPYVI
jgi:hypothetical protein